ncbi:hypothetical protein NKH73_14330 [Mesorhizobium sp. M0938]|uniref:hypothetical protein n=1 Tax=unclassified Mesorhizobium TaxID=325217 RepID=UPI00333B4F16
MTDRLKVRFAYQRGFQVVDNNHVVETFDSKVEAFSYVNARGSRVWLSWSRTVIGGQSAPFDFTASFQQDAIGRIMKAVNGPSAGTWFWTCFEGGARGTVANKDEAAFEVERAYTRRVVKADWR